MFIKRGLSPFLGTVPFFLIFMFCLSSSTEGAEKGLAAWWTFDEGSGDVLHDKSGNGNDGKIYGATWSKDKISALVFDGVDDYVDCGNDVSLHIEGPLTITSWIKLATLPKKYEVFIVYKGAWNLGLDAPGNPFFWTKDAYGSEMIFMTANFGIPEDKWIHIAGVYDVDEEAMYIYVNAQLVHSVKRLDGVIAGCDYRGIVLGLMPDPPRHQLHGLISETKIYNRALSAKEIGSNYLLEIKADVELKKSVNEFLKKYIHYIGKDISKGNVKQFPDEEAVGGYSSYCDEKKSDDIAYVGWWKTYGLKPGNYNVYLRAKGSGTFKLYQFDDKTGKMVNSLPVAKIDSNSYELYCLGEFSYDGSYSLVFNDSSSPGLWVDYIFLTPTDVMIK